MSSATPHPTSVVVTTEERLAIEACAAELVASPNAAVDDPAWVDAATVLSNRLPERLRETLRRFRGDPGPGGMLLLRDLPIVGEALPLTPTVPESVERVPSMSAAVLSLVSLHLGELVAYHEEKRGALVQNVVPVPGMEEFQGNAGSVALTLHVENAFHPQRPDYVALLCLRNDHDDAAVLTVACVRRALRRLSSRAREVLHEERFETRAPASFGDIDGAEAHGILYGSPDDPGIKVDFASTRPLDTAAEVAMAELGEALRGESWDTRLRPGDLAIVDNRLALHGRSVFRPRYDGYDRWLQRAFVQADFRSSRANRPNGGRVIHLSRVTAGDPATGTVVDAR